MRPFVVASVTLLLMAACNPDPTTSAPPPATAEVPPFSVTKFPVGPGTSIPLTHSWREGCPVHHTHLAALRVSYWGYDGQRHIGVLVMHATLTDELTQVMRQLYDARFPIRRIHPIDFYDGDDDLSMANNNTSMFNCRTVAGTDRWSEHAYGRAIDLNPIQNPYVKGSRVDPPAGRDWTDRSHVVPGMIVRGDVVTSAFDAIGWGWGGDWRSAKDYQHFSGTGR